MKSWCSLIAALLFVSSVSHAHDITGVYRGSGHYRAIEITQRGPDFTLETCGVYGPVCLPLIAILRAVAPGQYESIQGAIHVSYGMECTYPVSLNITYADDKIWVSDYSPSVFPSWEWNQCPPESLLRYSTHIESQPYIKTME